jgi:hypothetical protein
MGAETGRVPMGHPQHLCLKDNDRRERESSSGEIRTLDCVEGEWEVRFPQRLPDGDHITRVLGQE